MNPRALLAHSGEREQGGRRISEREVGLGEGGRRVKRARRKWMLLVVGHDFANEILVICNVFP